MDALAFYDRQVREGARLPRGFKELFEPGADFRQQLELYATVSSVALNMCTYVLRELLAYALALT